MIMGETVQKQVGENIFYIRPISPFKAIGLLGDIQKLIGPALGKGLASFTNGGGDAKSLLDRKVDGSMLAEAFEALAEHVDGAKLENMVRRILDQQFVAVQMPQDDTPARLTEAKANEVFLGCPGDMFAVIAAVLEATYGDFFGKLTSLTGRLGVGGQK